MFGTILRLPVTIYNWATSQYKPSPKSSYFKKDFMLDPELFKKKYKEDEEKYLKLRKLYYKPFQMR